MSPSAIAVVVFTTAILCIAGCTDPTQVRTVLLNDCHTLRVQGDVSLMLNAESTSQAAAHIELSGSAEALESAAIEEVQGSLSLLVADSAKLKVQVFCPALRTVELLGAVRAHHAAGTVPEYQKLALYGSSEFVAGSMIADHLDLRAAGSARVEIRNLVAESVQVLASGNTHVLVSGEAVELTFDVGGQASVDTLKLAVQWVDVKARGSSRLAVYASAHLGGSLDETANLSYRGDPDIALNTAPGASLQSL